MTGKIRAVLLSAGLSFLALSSEAAVIYLKDGSRLVGTIVGATARDVQIHTQDGNVRVDADRIERIDYREAEPPVADYRAPRGPEPGNEQQQYFGLTFGMAAPVSEIDFESLGGETGRNGDPGFLAGAQYLVAASPKLWIGLDLSYFHRSAASSQDLFPGGVTDVSGESVLILPTIKYAFVARGWARPFISGGLGAHRTSTIIDSTPLPGFQWDDTHTGETRRLVEDSSWGLASAVKLGVDFYSLGPDVLSFEAGWQGLFNGRYDPTLDGRDVGLGQIKGPLHAVTVSARWGWRF